MAKAKKNAIQKATEEPQVPEQNQQDEQARREELELQQQDQASLQQQDEAGAKSDEQEQPEGTQDNPEPLDKGKEDDKSGTLQDERQENPGALGSDNPQDIEQNPDVQGTPESPATNAGVVDADAATAGQDASKDLSAEEKELAERGEAAQRESEAEEERKREEREKEDRERDEKRAEEDKEVDPTENVPPGAVHDGSLTTEAEQPLRASVHTPDPESDDDHETGLSEGQETDVMDKVLRKRGLKAVPASASEGDLDEDHQFIRDTFTRHNMGNRHEDAVAIVSSIRQHFQKLF